MQTTSKQFPCIGVIIFHLSPCDEAFKKKKKKKTFFAKEKYCVMV